jgi:hypothetical protein
LSWTCRIVYKHKYDWIHPREIIFLTKSCTHSFFLKFHSITPSTTSFVSPPRSTLSSWPRLLLTLKPTGKNILICMHVFILLLMIYFYSYVDIFSY